MVPYIFFKIIRTLNINKVYGHDHKAVRVLQICSFQIQKLLGLIYGHCFSGKAVPKAYINEHNRLTTSLFLFRKCVVKVFL